MALPERHPVRRIREDLRTCPLEERLRRLGISLAPATPAVLQRRHSAVAAVKRWAEQADPIKVSSEELLSNEWEESAQTNG